MEGGLLHDLVFNFPGGKLVVLKKSEKSNISDDMQLFFLIVITVFWKNDVLLHKNYRDDRDIINQDHGKGNFSQFCLYLGYPRTNFTNIFITIMASCPAKKVLSSDIENVGQGHYLKKSLYVSYYANGFYQIL